MELSDHLHPPALISRKQPLAFISWVSHVVCTAVNKFQTENTTAKRHSRTKSVLGI